MRSSRLYLAPILGTLLILASRLRPLAPLVDAATGLPFPEARLHLPPAHLLLTPFSAWADLITCNSLKEHIALLAFLLLGYGPFRWLALGHGRQEWNSPRAVLKSLALYLGLCAAFIAWAVFGPRSPSRLVLQDPDLIAVDFHSHTSRSWDGRKSFTPERNAAWHQRTGFDGGFVTDHNTAAGSSEAKSASLRDWSLGRRGYASFEGEEVSLKDSHIVVLGQKRPIDSGLYAHGIEDVRRFLREAGPLYGGLTVMSLPEYWKNHRGRLEELADWGANGFEIVNGAPRGMDFPEEGRRRVVEICRRRNLFLAGASDNHGYGETACVWNVLRIPGWREMNPDLLQKAVTDALRREGFGAVRVIARNRLAPADSAMIWLDAPRALWVMLRAFTGAQALAALLWLWLLSLAFWRAAV